MKKIELSNLDFSRFAQRVQEEITVASTTIKEKKLGRFARPLVICAIMILGAYRFVYAPPRDKLDALQKKIAAARATAQYADSYKDLRDQLQAVYGLLPDPKDRERWVTDTVIDALKADGLVADAISPREEQVSHGFAAQKITVSLTAKFSEAYAMVRRLEAIRPILRLVNIQIAKGNKLEMNTVTCSVGTIVPVQKAR